MLAAPEMLWFWAKLGSAIWPESYHPVLCHLVDVGAVARELWGSAVRSRVKDAIAEQLGLLEAEAGAWISFWVAAHDIGKVTPCFQAQGNSGELRDRLLKAGYGRGAGENIHHTYTGTRVIYDLLRSDAVGVNVGEIIAQKVAVTTGGHHGTFPTDWRDRSVNELKGDKWVATRTAILAELARRFGVIGLKPPCLKAPDDQSVWMFLAGLTSVADWIGSNIEFFPPLVGDSRKYDDPFDLDDYIAWAAKQAADSLIALGWLGRDEPTHTLRPFAEVTGIPTPRPLQGAVIAIAERMKTPQLVIVEAPMGEGKTEAAWYVADCWDRRGGAGSYVALPTMATSNQMFGRVGNFLATGYGKKNLMLQHGKAALNEQFERLQFAARVYDDGSKTASGVVAEEWFAKNKKHGLLAPYGVGTIDQVLLAVLQTKHVFVRLFGLAGKCVILDEVHAYDAYMTTLMERLLRWLAALGCPVVLLSATLPKEKRAKLLNAYAGTELPDPANVAYPRVTTVAVGDPQTVVTPIPAASPPRNSTVHLRWLPENGLAETLKRALADGGCAAVIRNTVGLAQSTYMQLKAAFAATDIEVELFHARFPFGRRQEIEDAVLKRFGKAGGPPERNRRVLVATQVIEQSLDLDFDMMVTDVAPVDLILQRAGRLHRHSRGERPKPVRVPNLWLIEPGEKDGRPDFGASEWVYDLHVLLRSHLVIHGREAVMLPDEIDGMIDAAYRPELPLGPAEWGDALATSHKRYVADEKEYTKAALQFSILEPIDEDDILERFNRGLHDSDDPNIPKGRQAMTRLTEHSVQVIFIYEHPHGLALDSVGKHPVDLRKPPRFRELSEYVRNSASLSHKPFVKWYADRDPPAGWREVGLLRFYRVILLRPDGVACETEFPLLNCPETGIRFLRKEEVQQ